MKKIFIVILSYFLVNCALSSEISLLCKIQSTFTASNGNTAKEYGRAIVEITDQPNFKMVMISSDLMDSNNFAVSTKLPPSLRGEVSDFSTKSKWEIHNTIEKDDVRINNRVMIDRVTGILVLSSEQTKNNGRTTYSNVSGDCSKNDKTSKKF